ncbi:MAG: hypothetical protein ACR2NQ_01680 [Thermodesulfobacteriota bacterium]
MTGKTSLLPPDYIEIPAAAADDLEKSLKNPAPGKIAAALWRRDSSVWKGSQELIKNRLGWLDLPENTARKLPEIERFSRRVREAGATRVTLAAMGGSALMSKVFGGAFLSEKSPRLEVLDTTVADTIAGSLEKTDFEKTFFIASSKSGKTVETASVANFFFDECSKAIGEQRAAERFAAITDPGTPLFESARERGFGAIFEGDETVGGRFSPLSVFGMVPSAAIGADIGAILSSARDMSARVKGTETGGANCNTALRLAVAVDLFCKRGNGKFYVRCSDGIAGFDRFVEQIVGESLGKDGAAVLPVAHPLPESGREKFGGAFFVCLKNDEETFARAKKTADSGVPVVITVVDGKQGLGGEIFRWETAVAIAGAMWGVNPFDQPDVENAKAQARRFMEIHSREGSLPFPAPDFTDGGAEFSATEKLTDADGFRPYFEKNAAKKREDGYFCVQAFLDGADEKNRLAMEKFRAALSQTFGVTVTADIGPAYLHSSGQIHKGDGGKGFFIQIGGACAKDVAIPASPHSGASFEILKNAQMLGDREALENAGRKVVQITSPAGAADAIAKASKLLGIDAS